jgi:hypothetical protein
VVISLRLSKRGKHISPGRIGHEFSTLMEKKAVSSYTKRNNLVRLSRVGSSRLSFGFGPPLSQEVEIGSIRRL